MNYTKKPVTIQAWQLTIDNYLKGVPELFKNPYISIGYMKTDGEIVDVWAAITTLEGNMLAQCGDWLIRGVNGEFYSCKPNIFEKTYMQEFDTKDCIKELLKLRASADKELAHIKADEILCNVLRAYGQDELVKEFEDMDKWYC